MNFTTEIEITLPFLNEQDYLSGIHANVGKFLGKVPKAYQETISVKYVPGENHNIVSFTWPESLIGSTKTGDEKLMEASEKVCYWFRHCPFFKRHGARNITVFYS